MARPQYVNLQFQPGLFKNGTVYQAQGRWYDADLMRWSNGALGPMGGWRGWGESTTAVTGVPRTSALLLVKQMQTLTQVMAIGCMANLATGLLDPI